VLKFLIRAASLGTSVFLCALAALFILAEEDAFPAGTQTSASLDFSQTETGKDELIASLSELADESDVFLAKVVADPNDFYNSRSLYVFGKSAPSHPTNIGWFKPGMRGELRPALDLGTAPLTGVYVFSGSPSTLTQFAPWLDAHKVQYQFTAKTVPGLLQQAIVATGSWLAFLTCAVLLVSLAVTWSVLRAQVRVLKMLCGAPTRFVVLADLGSLMVEFARSASIAWSIALGVVVVCGRESKLPHFAAVSGSLILAAFLLILVFTALASAMTWPSVEGMASREPPERHFRAIGEILKAASLVIVAVALPVAGASISQAMTISHQDSQWDVLKEHVTVRTAFRSEEDFARGQAGMGRMAAAAEEAGHLTLSYSADATNLDGYEGVAWVNRHYLRTIAPLVGESDSAEALLKKVSLEDLPASVGTYVKDQYSLLNRSGRNLEGIENHISLFRYAGTQSLPVLSSKRGELHRLANPLVVLVDAPANAVNDQNLGALMMSGNMNFDSAAWVGDYLATHPLGTKVLSVDRISDSALFNSQLQNQSAWMKSLSFVLVVLALVMSVAVSAIVYALSAARKLFAQRTCGWSWAHILSRRLAWDGALALIVAGGMFIGSGAGAKAETWWIPAAAPIFATVSIWLHVWSSRTIFAKTLARRA
jgi:hypothetical protein